MIGLSLRLWVKEASRMLLSNHLSNHVYNESNGCCLDKRIHIPREPFNSTFGLDSLTVVQPSKKTSCCKAFNP